MSHAAAWHDVRSTWGMALRVMTYNIHGGRGLDMRGHAGAKPHGLSRIAEVIRSFDPDIVALQEVDVGRTRSGNVDQAQELADALGMEMRFVPTLEDGSGRYGIATLTRLPLLDDRQICLPQRRHDSEPRCALVTRHRWNGGEIEMINTHLSIVFGERPFQVAAITSERLGEALVIAGDFNMTPWSRAYKLLARGLRSATRFARTWPAPAPIAPLDHILFRGRLQLVRGGAWTRGGARRASDHLPVIAELEQAVAA